MLANSLGDIVQRLSCSATCDDNDFLKIHLSIRRLSNKRFLPICRMLMTLTFKLNPASRVLLFFFPLLMVACLFLCLPRMASAETAIEDFIGTWTSNSGNVLEYRQSGQQIEVVMTEPSQQFKELGYVNGEITGHYQFADGKITGKILLKFPGCQAIWVAVSNEISDLGVMTSQTPMLRCNQNKGLWESLGGTNPAFLKRTPKQQSSAPTQQPQGCRT